MNVGHSGITRFKPLMKISHDPRVSLAGDEFHWKDAVISVVVLTLGSWLIFIKGLNLVLPLWPKFITG